MEKFELEEIEKFHKAAEEFLNECMKRFVANLKKGKFGWDRPNAWTSFDSPLTEAKGEIEEALDAVTPYSKIREIGDSGVYLIFAHNLVRTMDRTATNFLKEL